MFCHLHNVLGCRGSTVPAGARESKLSKSSTPNPSISNRKVEVAESKSFEVLESRIEHSNRNFELAVESNLTKPFAAKKKPSITNSNVQMREAKKERHRQDSNLRGRNHKMAEAQRFKSYPLTTLAL
jgi:hypothetical protein